MNASTEPPFFTEEEIIHMLLKESPIAKNIIKHLILDLFEGRRLEQLEELHLQGCPYYLPESVEKFEQPQTANVKKQLLYEYLIVLVTLVT